MFLSSSERAKCCGAAIHGNTFHFNEPRGAADGSQGDDIRDVGETLLEHPADKFIVGCVAQIDDDLHDIGKGHAAFGKQVFHIFPHAAGLLLDVSQSIS